MPMNAYRADVVDILQIFASKSERYDLFVEKGDIDLPNILLTRWENTYIQNNRNFGQAFSEKELLDLNCFYDFLLARMDEFSGLRIETLKQSLYCDSLCRLAAELLESFSQNAAIDQ